MLIPVVIADDHAIILDALRPALAKDPDLVLKAAATDGAEALAAIREHQPKVAVLDLVMPKLNGLQILDAIVADNLPTRVMFFTGAPDAVRSAMSAGAQGYLLKSQKLPEVLKAIKKVAAGGKALDGEPLDYYVNQVRAHESGVRLTDRQTEVLRLLRDKLPPQVIAERLGVTKGTARSHIHNTYAKLRVNSAAAAVAEGRRRGLI